MSIDYRCNSEKKVVELRGDKCCQWIDPDSLFDKISAMTPKNTNRSARTSIQRYPLQDQGLDLPIFKPGCRA
jgi:hypothetical protein